MYCPKCGAGIVPGTAFCPICGGGLEPAAAPVQPIQPAYAATPPYAYRGWDYATWGTRAIGYIVDALLVGVGMAVLYFVLGGILASMMSLSGLHGVGSGMCCLT